MNKLDLARRLAKESHRSKAKVADDVDSLVHRLLKKIESATKPRGPKKSPSQTAPKTGPDRES